MTTEKVPFPGIDLEKITDYEGGDNEYETRHEDWGRPERDEALWTLRSMLDGKANPDSIFYGISRDEGWIDEGAYDQENHRDWDIHSCCGSIYVQWLTGPSGYGSIDVRDLGIGEEARQRLWDTYGEK